MTHRHQHAKTGTSPQFSSGLWNGSQRVTRFTQSSVTYSSVTSTLFACAYTLWGQTLANAQMFFAMGLLANTPIHKYIYNLYTLWKYCMCRMEWRNYTEKLLELWFSYFSGTEPPPQWLRAIPFRYMNIW